MASNSVIILDDGFGTYNCKYCKKSYKSLKSYNNHLKIHQEQKLGLDQNVADKLEYVKEKKEDINKIRTKKKKCKICSDTIFNTEEDYLYHIKQVHDGKYVDYTICEDCGKQFRTKTELKHHIDSKCSTIKRYKCKFCDLHLMTAGSLYNHLLRHNGERSFMCRFCAKMFLTAGQLKVHERKHTQEKAFICNVCGKGFSYRQSLITHSTLHTGIKPYQCENCGNSFSCVGNLLKHRKWHPDTCGSVPSTTHRMNNPSTKIKVKVNTPSSSRLLKLSKKDKEIKEKLNVLEEKLKTSQTKSKNLISEIHNSYSPEKVSVDTACNTEPEISLINNDLKIEESESTDLYDNDLSVDSTQDEQIIKEIIKGSCNKKAVGKLENHTGKVSKNKTQEKKTECKHCGKNILNRKALLRHEKKHQNLRKVYNCSSCKEVFPSKEERKLHIEKNHADDLTCQECDKIFTNKDSLKKHQKNAREKTPRKTYLYICEKCGKEFKQKQTLQNHRESLCGTSLSYECNICHKKFTSIYIRNNHMKVHEAKKLLCKFCGKSFHWKGQLKIHERSHTGEKPYTCLYCPKAFAYRESLLTHSTIHTGIKPYICESCGYSFSCIGNLIKHKDTHANVCGPYNKAQV